jgi:sigma-E factor negative regulatory protein RseC
MMEETGIVLELKPNQVAVVLCQKTSACNHCVSKSSCISGADQGAMQVEAHNPVAARVGDRVKLVTSSRIFLRSSFLLYIVPLIALLIGAVAGQLLGERLPAGPDPNLLAAILGCAFLVGSFLTIRLGTRALPPENYMPSITEILTAESDPSAGPNHEH